MQRKATLVDANHIDCTLEGVLKDNPNEVIEEAIEEILQDPLEGSQGTFRKSILRGRNNDAA